MEVHVILQLACKMSSVQFGILVMNAAASQQCVTAIPLRLGMSTCLADCTTLAPVYLDCLAAMLLKPGHIEMQKEQ